MTQEQTKITSNINVNRIEAGGTAVATYIENYHGLLASAVIPLDPPPLRAAHFTNREADLDQLLANLQLGQVAALCGSAGMGKTALAAEAIQKLSPDNAPPQKFPDGILYHNFQGQPQIDLALKKIAMAYGHKPKPTPFVAAQRALGGRQALLLFDGAEEADDLPRLLDACGNCGVLVISRRREDAMAVRQDVVKLSMAHAIELLQKWGGQWAVDETAVRTICERVGGWPLAIRLAGHYMKVAEEEASDYLMWLETTPLEALIIGNRPQDNINIFLEKSVEQVDAKAQRILALMGQLALQTVAADGVAAAVKLSTGQLKLAWWQLLNYGLLQKRDDGYEVTHPLIHTYASQQLELSTADFDRLANYYVELIKAETRQGTAGYRRLAKEIPHLLQILDGCLTQENWEMARLLASVLTEPQSFLWLQGYWSELTVAVKGGLTATQHLSDRRTEGIFLGNLGACYYQRGQVREAERKFEEALTIAREVDDRQQEGAMIGNLGNVYSYFGQLEKSIIFYERAKLIAHDADNLQGKGRWAGNLGIIFLAQEQTEKAVDCFKKSLDIARKLGDPQQEVTWLGYLGISYRKLGKTRQAINCFNEGLGIARDIGYRLGEATQLGNLGNAFSEFELHKSIQSVY